MDLLYGTVRAEGTGKGLLPSVGEDMSLEVVLDCCCVHAVRARKGPLPGVAPHMPNEVGLDNG